MTDLDLDTDRETRHRITRAFELTWARGCPLRDAEGFAARLEDVELLVAAVFAQPRDEDAVAVIATLIVSGRTQIMMGPKTVADEEYLWRVVESLRPLVEQRRKAAERALR